MATDDVGGCLGCGCGSVLLAGFGFLGWMGWLVYDGFYIRELPEDQAELVDGRAPQPWVKTDEQDVLILNVSIDNRSEYIIRDIVVNVRFEAEPVTFWQGMCFQDLRQRNVRVLANSEGGVFCRLKGLPDKVPEDTEYLKSYKWWFQKLEGHRPPIRLYKDIADGIMEYYEPVNE